MKFTLCTALLLPTLITAATIPHAKRTPPGIPTLATAKKELAALTVQAPGSQDGYERSKFKTWITISGTCDTREYVLKRDGTDVVVDSSCKSTSGTWVSPYDGATWTSASDLDIDHFVPLSNAWKTGASSWTADQREAFANDVTNPQLWAVTDTVNESKGDSGPEDWKPPLTSFYCTYAKTWIRVKSIYNLTINSDEKTALTSMIGTC